MIALAVLAGLAAAITQLPESPGLEVAQANVEAATAAATPETPVELLLAIAWGESHWHPDSVSRVAPGGARVTGHWPGTRRPPGGGPYFCGVTQAAGRSARGGVSWARCLELRRLPEAYRATVAELENWRRICGRLGVRGPARLQLCALAGYRAGMRGARGARRPVASARAILARAARVATLAALLAPLQRTPAAPGYLGRRCRGPGGPGMPRAL